MFPKGFLGTRADLLFDLVILSLLAIVPALIWSYRLAKNRNYVAHKRAQIVLTAVLAVVLTVFEINLRAGGGIFEITRESRYAGTWVLSCSVYTHLIFAFSTAVIWVGLMAASLWKFPDPPVPNSFSRAHRIWGRIAMIDLFLTGATALELYAVGFIF